MDKTKIEWAHATVNPIRARHRETGRVGVHCEHACDACRYCYAEAFNKRLGTGLDFKPANLDRVEIFLDMKPLAQMLRWQRPRRIFLGSTTDIFGRFVSDDMRDRIFAAIALAPQHRVMVLTKRPAEARRYLDAFFEEEFEHRAGVSRVTRAVNDVLMETGRNWGQCHSTSSAITTLITRGAEGAREPGMLRLLADGKVQRLVGWNPEQWFDCAEEFAAYVRDKPLLRHESEFGWGLKMWPLPNLALGVSVGDQRDANLFIPELLQARAELRFVSYEPALGPVDFTRISLGTADATFADHPEIKRANFTIDALRGVESFGWPGLDLLIAGGESGRKARPAHPDWIRSARDQCEAAGVAFNFKQWGEWAPHKPQAGGDLGGDVRAGRVQIVHPTGQSDIEIFRATGRNTMPGSRYMARIGKKEAGRLLDGRLHDAMPPALSLPEAQP